MPRHPSPEFRKLATEELPAAHAIIAEATAWLKERGVVQWPRVLPFETYRERQERGENFGLFEPSLAAVMTLAPKVPDHWNDRDYVRPMLWLSTLAVRRDSSGAGRRAIAEAERFAFAAGFNALYLDCVDREDALPSFYRAAGFNELERREVWPGWPMCLFEKLLARPREPRPAMPPEPATGA